MPNRSMIKLIHADDFFSKEDAVKLSHTIGALDFQPSSYGFELPDFNMIQKGIEPLLSKVVGERLEVVHKESGIFRKPIDSVIHFEHFESLNEWCFINALEPTTLNLYHHIDKDGNVDAETIMDKQDLNFKNLFEWNVHTNVIMRPGDGVFIRPWVFHSMDGGLVQYYRVRGDSKFRVLIMGKPGSCRKELAKKLSEKIENSVLLNSMEERVKAHNDIDFSKEGIERHTYRMLTECRQSESDAVIIDMVAPYHFCSELIDPDVLIYCEGGEKSEVDAYFEEPISYNMKVKSVDDETVNEVLNVINTNRVHYGR